MTIAWVFPGQGSQKLGMANSLLELPGSRDRFELASEVLGRDLWKICCGEGVPNEEIYDLNDTRNTQPALFVVESLLVDDLKRQERETQIIAGHSLGEILEKYQIKSESIDWLLLHQANQRILDAVASRFSIPSEKVLSNLKYYGNTSAATIPLMLDEAVRDKRIKSGDLIACSGFGAGLSWGAALFYWHGPY